MNLKMIFEFILSIFFDHKDEYKPFSHRFSFKKVFILITFFISIFLNAFLIYKYYQLGMEFIHLQKTVKNQNTSSSDSQNPPRIKP